MLPSSNNSDDEKMVVRRVSKARKLAGIVLVAIAISVSAAGPAHATGEDAATGAVCNVAYYFYPSYYWDYCYYNQAN